MAACNALSTHDHPWGGSSRRRRGRERAEAPSKTDPVVQHMAADIRWLADACTARFEGLEPLSLERPATRDSRVAS